MKTRFPRLTGLLLGIPLVSACVFVAPDTTSDIRVGHAPLAPPKTTFDEAIAMEHPAEDLRHDTGPFGTVTSTVFLLPVGRIDSRIPLQEALVWEVASALEAAGYKVMMVEAGVSHAHVDKWPSLRVVIEEFKFRNDSYVYPVIPTRGEVALRMKARDAGGRVVFDQTFRASVASYCSTPFLVTLLTFDCAFANAVNEAMTEVLNSILAAVSSDEFRKVFTPREGQQK